MSIEKIYILANTSARTLNLKELEATAAHMNRFIPSVIFPTSSAEHAMETTAELAQNNKNLVVACGGDGTIHTILNALPKDTHLGIIPAGTANVIARELGIPLDLKNAGKAVLTGAVTPVDLGFCNGRKFAFVGGTGFDAHVAGAVPPFLKSIFGRKAYHITGLAEFITYKPPHLQIEVDNKKTFNCRFAIIANMRRYGGELFFAPQARYDDQQLNLVMLHKFSAKTLLQLLNFARRNGPFPHAAATSVACRSCIVKPDRPTPWQLDGEVFPVAESFEFSVCEHPARIITP